MEEDEFGIEEHDEFLGMPTTRNRALFYDYDGEPIIGGMEAEALRFGELVSSDGKFLAQTTVKYRREWYRVSTIWTGIDHSHGLGMFPVIWETMIFPRNKNGRLWQVRYASKRGAYKGHREAVRKLKGGQIYMYARKRKHRLFWKTLFRPNSPQGAKTQRLTNYKYLRRR